jgi:hypothetical protein
MAYPYSKLTAQVGLGCDESGEWMYVSLSDAPNIANVETEEKANRFIAKITFDEQTYEYEMTQTFGSRSLHFRDDNVVSAWLLSSSSMVFEIDWHREGKVRFDFPLAGSAEAIAGAREKCTGL